MRRKALQFEKSGPLAARKPVVTQGFQSEVPTSKTSNTPSVGAKKSFPGDKIMTANNTPAEVGGTKPANPMTPADAPYAGNTTDYSSMTPVHPGPTGAELPLG